jgi:hypothetical protein
MIFMGKTKIAESIIIRVGGGIREIRREPIETPDVVESVHTETDLEHSEDLHSFGPGLGSTKTRSKDKIIN